MRPARTPYGQENQCHSICRIHNSSLAPLRRFLSPYLPSPRILTFAERELRRFSITSTRSSIRISLTGTIPGKVPSSIWMIGTITIRLACKLTKSVTPPRNTEASSNPEFIRPLSNSGQQPTEAPIHTPCNRAAAPATKKIRCTGDRHAVSIQRGFLSPHIHPDHHRRSCPRRPGHDCGCFIHAAPQNQDPGTA